MKLGYIILYVSDVDATLNFYHKAFGLEKGFYHESGQYAEMITGETTLAFVHHETASSHGFNYQVLKKSELPPPVEIAFTTNDVHQSYKQAVEVAGALSLSAPQKKPWGQTVAYVKDLNGFIVELCSPM